MNNIFINDQVNNRKALINVFLKKEGYMWYSTNQLSCFFANIFLG